MLLTVEELACRVLFDDLALLQEDHADCHLAGKTHFVAALPDIWAEVQKLEHRDFQMDLPEFE
ncbi:hypothetical protein QO002_006164 [Pararhizobium capsulatum DSM 1112]|uniref:Uncharacterized protein n=1 Tax=Pararhizobium capsulatum DSM 1112 TaxID=1121113 RepID=A0ABU0C166_9HYPH|nr:hypothetical protein [Pararhizobium capsulatum DSM 1112]